MRCNRRHRRRTTRARGVDETRASGRPAGRVSKSQRMTEDMASMAALAHSSRLASRGPSTAQQCTVFAVDLEPDIAGQKIRLTEALPSAVKGGYEQRDSEPLLHPITSKTIE